MGKYHNVHNDVINVFFKTKYSQNGLIYTAFNLYIYIIVKRLGL